MTTSIVECPHCHYTFNYEFIPGASFHSIRLGTQRLFRCPHCHELHRFTVTHFSTNSALHTYGDNKETGIGLKVWGFMLLPLAILLIIGIIQTVTYSFLGPYFLLILVSIGVIWIIIYNVYLIVESGKDVNHKKNDGLK
jgi:hypothetical protein